MPTFVGFLEAIAREEGFYVDRSRAQRNNNPGNIEWGAFARMHGATRAEAAAQGARFAVFPSVASGFACMAALFSSNYVGLTFASAIAKWAPPDENNTAQYVRNVCMWTGLPPDTLLAGHIAPPTLEAA